MRQAIKRCGDKRLYDERLSDKRLNDKRLSEKRLYDERLSDKRLNDKRLSEKRLYDERLSDKRLSDKRLSEKRLDDGRRAITPTYHLPIFTSSRLHIFPLHQRHAAHAQQHLGGYFDIFFAVGLDAFVVFFCPVDVADLAAVDVVFGGGDAENGG